LSKAVCRRAKMRGLFAVFALASAAHVQLKQFDGGIRVRVVTDAPETDLLCTLQRDTTAFHPNYKEVHIVDGEPVVTRHGPRDHARGLCAGTWAGKDVEARASATLEDGVVESLVVRSPGAGTLDVAWDGERHVVHEAAPLDELKFAPPRVFEPPPGTPPPDDSRRRNLRANECRDGAVKYVSVVVFNDASRYAQRGREVEANSAKVFDIVNAIYTDPAPYGLYNGAEMNCRLVPIVAGQMVFRDGNPPDLDYVQGGACRVAQCDGFTCGNNEISASCLLDSFAEYVHSHRRQLEKALDVEIDNAHLLTARNLGGSTIGLGYLGQMCGPLGRSASLEQSSFASTSYLAAVCAHEMGHNLGMNHDKEGKYLMAPSMSAGDPSGVELQFSKQSRKEVARWFESSYGVRMNGACLENEVLEDAWDAALCGDGVVDDGEDCDPGLTADECCDSRCRLIVGCQCAVADACCTDEGTFVKAGTECRGAKHGDCDNAERCTGISGDCPMDLFSAPGEYCRDETADGRLVDGACYRGECISFDDSCAGVKTWLGEDAPVACPEFSTCDGVFCKRAQDREDGAFCVPSRLPAEDGTACGDRKQCVDRGVDSGSSPGSGGVAQCVDSSSLELFHWDTGPDGCARDPSCVDQEGLAVDASRCRDDPPTRPRRCDGASGTPDPEPDGPSGYFDDDFDEGAAGDDDAEAQNLLLWWVVIFMALCAVLAGLCCCGKSCAKTRKPPRAQQVELRPVEPAYYVDRAPYREPARQPSRPAPAVPVQEAVPFGWESSDAAPRGGAFGWSSSDDNRGVARGWSSSRSVGVPFQNSPGGTGAVAVPYQDEAAREEEAIAASIRANEEHERERARRQDEARKREEAALAAAIARSLGDDSVQQQANMGTREWKRRQRRMSELEVDL